MQIYEGARFQTRISHSLFGISDVERAFDKRLVVQNVRVNLRRPHVFMPEQFLNGADVVLIFEQARRKAVAKGVAISVFDDFGLSYRIADGFLDCRSRYVMTARFAVIARRRDFR